MASVRGFTPNGGRVLVETVKVAPTILENNIELSENKNLKEGKVIEVGPECKVRVGTGKVAGTENIVAFRLLNEGDVVVFPAIAGVDISRNLGTQDGIYYVLHDGEILCTRGLAD